MMQSVDEDFKVTGWMENESRYAIATWITEMVGQSGCYCWAFVS